MLPEVIQVISTDDYKVYVYMDDNTVRLYDASLASHTGPAAQFVRLLQNGHVRCLVQRLLSFSRWC